MIFDIFNTYFFLKRARQLFILMLSIASFSVLALQPTPQQIEQFKRMSPAEQSILARQFGVAVPQAGSVNSVSTVVQETTVQPRAVLDPEVVSPTIDKRAHKEELTPFGYDLFAGNPTSFAPINDVPVSSDYVLGPGDSLKVNLHGKESQSFELLIDQEGSAYLPKLGPIFLSGQTFSEAKKHINNVINKKMIGIKASVAMGQLRSIRVFVLGEAHLPGSYVISSLSTITNALLLSGGISENGSLRNIQLKRKGELIQTLDVYDLLLKGDTSNDAQLTSGDVVFIPPLGATVGVKGEVRRSGRYELQGNETAKTIIQYAGGLRSSAFPQSATLQRIDQNNERTLLNVNLKSRSGLQTLLQNGDVISVPKVLPKIENIVKLSGHVIREENITWRPNLRLTDIVPEVERLKPNPDLHYGLIKRYQPPNRYLEVVSFSLAQAIAHPESQNNVKLREQDEVVFFGLYNAKEAKRRKDVIGSVMQEIREQAGFSQSSQEVSIIGDVRYPGTYPLTKGMEVSELLHAAGGLTERAFQLRAELSRIEFNEHQERNQYRVDLNLSSSESLSVVLKSRDELQIKTIPDWAESEQVTLSGEVKFPGTYPVNKNDDLALLLERAGGLTEYAYAPGAVFTRVELKEQQAQQLKQMQERLAEDIAKAELIYTNDENKSGDVGEAQKLLSQLKNTSAKGRLVVDLEKVLLKAADYSIPLQKGDTLHVPTRKNSVTIVGEVQMPISQIFEPQIDYWDYIARSGGTTDKADEERVYIIKANGSVQMPESSSWFASNQQKITPGDTIVVPLDADKLDQTVLWRDMSQIFYQIALGAAAVGSL